MVIPFSHTEEATFKAFATFAHLGDSHNHGHYVCCVKEKDTWVRYDDGHTPTFPKTWASICPPSDTVRVLYIHEHDFPPSPSPLSVSPTVSSDLNGALLDNHQPTSTTTSAVKVFLPPACPSQAAAQTATGPPAAPPSPASTTHSKHVATPPVTPNHAAPPADAPAVPFGRGLIHALPPAKHPTRMTDEQVLTCLRDLRLIRGDRLGIWSCVNGAPPLQAIFKVERLPTKVTTAQQRDKFRVHRDGSKKGVDVFLPNQSDTSYITHIEVTTRGKAAPPPTRTRSQSATTTPPTRSASV